MASEVGLGARNDEYLNLKSGVEEAATEIVADIDRGFCSAGEFGRRFQLLYGYFWG